MDEATNKFELPKHHLDVVLFFWMMYIFSVRLAFPLNFLNLITLLYVPYQRERGKHGKILVCPGLIVLLEGILYDRVGSCTYSEPMAWMTIWYYFT